MSIIKLFLSVIFILTFSGFEASGQDTSFPPLKGYKTISDYPVYTPDDLWNYINGAADAYLALGFINLHITEYVKGKHTIKAEMYRFGDDANAFGIYSLERSPGYDFIQTGVQGYKEEGVVNFYKGQYYVKIMTHSKSGKVNESMKYLADMIAERITGKNEFPALLRTFPSDGLLKNEETYILDGVLGHDYLRGAYRASYEVEGDRFDIYLFDNGSVADAALMVAKITDAPSGSLVDEADKYVIEDGFNGVLYLAREGSRLVIISGLDRNKTTLAERYLNLIISR